MLHTCEVSMTGTAQREKQFVQRDKRLSSRPRRDAASARHNREGLGVVNALK